MSQPAAGGGAPKPRLSVSFYGKMEFVLKASDVLAPAIVATWARAQHILEDRAKQGMSLTATLQTLEMALEKCFEDFTVTSEPSRKVLGAYVIAGDLQAAPVTKKIAD